MADWVRRGKRDEIGGPFLVPVNFRTRKAVLCFPWLHSRSSFLKNKNFENGKWNCQLTKQNKLVWS